MQQIIRATIWGLIAIFCLSAISDAIALSNEMGPSLNQNWYNAMIWLRDNTPNDSIVATWWDPGHWITGIAERGAYADGAHCYTGVCIPYPLNTRIVDMGKILTADNEEEAVAILKKYTNFTPEQCEMNRKKYGDVVPCHSPSEMYFIASSDLISKYPWPAYFGRGEQEQFYQIGLQPLTDQSGNTIGFYDACLKYDNAGQCTQFNFLITQVKNKLTVVYQNRYLVKKVQYYGINGTTTDTFENATLDGLFWIGPDFSYAFYMTPGVENSLFTRLYFFDGQGLKHFKQVFNNGEVKIYKVEFD